MVRHHLLLPTWPPGATSPTTTPSPTSLRAVGTPLLLDLLHALTEADCGWPPAARRGATWKAGLVADLVERTHHVLGGGELHEVGLVAFPTAELLAAMAAVRTVVRGEGTTLTVVAPDRPGLFARVAGVLALHGARTCSPRRPTRTQGMAASEFTWSPPPERPVPWDRVTADLDEALAGRLALEARLAERARDYAGASPQLPVGPARGDGSQRGLLERHRGRGAGPRRHRRPLPHHRALAELQLDIRHAKVPPWAPRWSTPSTCATRCGNKVTDADPGRARAGRAPRAGRGRRRQGR